MGGDKIHVEPAERLWEIRGSMCDGTYEYRKTNVLTGKSTYDFVCEKGACRIVKNDKNLWEFQKLWKVNDCNSDNDRLRKIRPLAGIPRNWNVETEWFRVNE